MSRKYQHISNPDQRNQPDNAGTLLPHLGQEWRKGVTDGGSAQNEIEKVSAVGAEATEGTKEIHP